MFEHVGDVGPCEPFVVQGASETLNTLFESPLCCCQAILPVPVTYLLADHFVQPAAGVLVSLLLTSHHHLTFGDDGTRRLFIPLGLLRSKGTSFRDDGYLAPIERLLPVGYLI